MMVKRISRRIEAIGIAMSIALTALAGPAAAQPPAAVSAAAAPPVDQLVNRALSRAPSVAARQQRIEAAGVASVAADALPDPMIEFEYQSFNFPRYTIGSDPGSMLGASVRQNLLSKGRRSASRALALAGVAESRAELTAWTTNLAAAVRTRYAQLYVIDRERETLADADQILRLIEATAFARYAAGDADQASVLRIQLERTRLGERLADLARERFAVTAALNRLMDDPPATPIGPVRELPVTAPPVTPASFPTAEALADATAQRAPDVAWRQASIDVAGRKVEAARQELKRSWSIGTGLYWQGGLDRMATFSVGIELPFWKKRKQRPLLAAAELEQAAARRDLEDAAAEARAATARLVTEWETASAQVERYRSAILPQNSAALDATRSSYLAGRGDFVSVLDEFRRWIDVRVGLAQREADRYTARVELDALLEPVTVPALK